MEYNKAESVLKAAEDAFPAATVSLVSHKRADEDRRYIVIVKPATTDLLDELKKVAENEQVDFEMGEDRAQFHAR